MSHPPSSLKDWYEFHSILESDSSSLSSTDWSELESDLASSSSAIPPSSLVPPIVAHSLELLKITLPTIEPHSSPASLVIPSTILDELHAAVSSLLYYSMGNSFESQSESKQTKTKTGSELADCAIKHNQSLVASNALPVYSSLFHIALFAHRTQIMELYDSSSSSSSSQSTANARVDSQALASHRNASDILTKPASFYSTSRLLRRTICLLFNLIWSHKSDSAVIQSTLHTSYLLNLCFECLGVIPKSDSSSSPNLDIDESESDDFIVEYSEHSHKSIRQPRSEARKSGMLANMFQTPTTNNTNDRRVDPSTNIKNEHWRQHAKRAFDSGVQLSHLSSVSFMPITQILLLIRITLQATNTLTAQPTPSTVEPNDSSLMSSLVAASSGQLYPFELQELCEVLSVHHGTIIFVPQAQTESQKNVEEWKRLQQFSIEPLTSSFPYLVTNSIPPAIKSQLVHLASVVVKQPESTSNTTPNARKKPLSAAGVFTLLLPHLSRYVISLSKLLVVLTPGFDLNQTIKFELEQQQFVLEMGGNTDASQSASPDTLSLIDLNQHLITDESILISNSADAASSFPIRIRQTREIWLDSISRILMTLRAITTRVPDIAAQGSYFPLRYWQQLMCEASFPLLASKCLSIDLAQSIMRTTESTNMQPFDNYPIIREGLSSRLLRSFVGLSSLIYSSIDSPASPSALLHMVTWNKIGMPKLLADLWTKFLSNKLPDEWSKLSQSLQSDPSAVKLWNLLREQVALGWRAFLPYRIAGMEQVVSPPYTQGETSIQSYLATHPSTLMHSTRFGLLFSNPTSPYSDVSRMLGRGAADQVTGDTLGLMRLLAVVQRRRFPYDEAAPTVTSTPRTSSAASPHPGSPTNVGPEATMPGLGLGFMFQPTSVWVNSLLSNFVRRRLGLPDHNATSAQLERSGIFAKTYPAEFELARSTDDKTFKVDKLLSLETRAGVFASTLGSSFDVFSTSGSVPAAALPKELTIYHYLILQDTLRRWATEHAFLVSFGVELSLLPVDLSHRPVPSVKDRLRRMDKLRRDDEEQRLEKYAAVASAAWRARQAALTASPVENAFRNGQPSGDSEASSASFFSHPFLRTSLTPTLLDALLRPSNTAAPMSASVHPSIATFAHMAKEGSLLNGRIEMSVPILQSAYSELIQNS